MASTREISVRYSQRVNQMASYIKQFLRENKSYYYNPRMHKAISDFCFNYPEEFRREFLNRIGLTQLRRADFNDDSTELFYKFIDHLCELPGECIFLLRDTHIIARHYQHRTRKGFGILVNREFLCGPDEERYFLLIDIIYASLAESTTLEEFLSAYKNLFAQLIETDSVFFERSKRIYQYIDAHSIQCPLIWVDLGFQFTLSLFCYASMNYHHGSAYPQDIFSFCVYPWLRERFKGKYFSDHNEYTLRWELEGIDSYANDLKGRSSGMLVGFAVGDSLGFPAAGIEKKEVLSIFNSQITSFTDNHLHPYFSHLKPGQYTDNTRLLMISAESIVRNNGLNLSEYQKDLALWAKDTIENPETERWAGPTALNACIKLLKGQDYLTSGSTETHSCSSTYRVIPLGIYFRSFDEIEELKRIASLAGMITHNSAITKVGAAFVALTIAELIRGVLPLSAVQAAIRLIGYTSECSLLIDRIIKAIEISEGASIDQARALFGTGSPIYQTLPLSIFCFLKYRNDYLQGLIAAANSCREDSARDKEKLDGLSWEDQIRICEGGNTDGIAALTGAFLGGHIGMRKLPARFSSIEDKRRLICLAHQLVT